MKKKFHNMFFLMLDPKFKFKNIHLMASITGLEQGKAIVKEYDSKPLYLMHLKSYFQWWEKHEIMFLLVNFYSSYLRNCEIID